MQPPLLRTFHTVRCRVIHLDAKSYRFTVRITLWDGTNLVSQYIELVNGSPENYANTAKETISEALATVHGMHGFEATSFRDVITKRGRAF